MKKHDQTEFGNRGETGDLYMLNKKERKLTIEVLKLTLATKTGREFLKQRFGREGIQIAANLLEEMGIKAGNSAEQKPSVVS